MSNRAGITDIPKQYMTLDNKKKIVLLRTKQYTAKLKILQWNAGGLSSAKMAELKQITIQNDKDLLIINEANSTEENTQYYSIKGFTTHVLYKGFTTHVLYKARQIASGLFVIIKNALKSEFKIIKEMNDHDTTEIVKISLWKENKKFTIYGIYSPPGNKNLLLDTLDITPSTVVIRDFNAASPSWGYNYYNHAGRTVEEFLNSQKLELLYHPEEQKTFLHYSGSTTNPDLTMVSSDTYKNSQKTVLEDLGSSHRATKITILLKAPTKNQTSELRGTSEKQTGLNSRTRWKLK